MIYVEVDQIDDNYTDEESSEYVIIVSDAVFPLIYQKCKGQQQEEVSRLQSTARKKIKRLKQKIYQEAYRRYGKCCFIIRSGHNNNSL